MRHEFREHTNGLGVDGPAFFDSKAGKRLVLGFRAMLPHRNYHAREETKEKRGSHEAGPAGPQRGVILILPSEARVLASCQFMFITTT